MVLLALGTTSRLKLVATSNVFYDLDVDVITVEGVDSGVPEQPKGYIEILYGARMRAIQARNKCPDADLWMGVESGLVRLYQNQNQNQKKETETKEKECWADLAAIVMLTKQGNKEILEWTDMLQVPLEMVQRGTWNAVKDPHTVLTRGKQSRQDYLQTGLKRVKTWYQKQTLVKV